MPDEFTQKGWSDKDDWKRDVVNKHEQFKLKSSFEAVTVQQLRETWPDNIEKKGQYVPLYCIDDPGAIVSTEGQPLRAKVWIDLEQAEEIWQKGHTNLKTCPIYTNHYVGTLATYHAKWNAIVKADGSIAPPGT
jgi:hypothetical protein